MAARAVVQKRTSKEEISLTPSERPTVEESLSVQYAAFVRKYPRLVNSVSHVVLQVANETFSEELISKENLSEASNCQVSEYQRASRLLLVIMSRIEESDAHFDTFVTILEQVNLTELAKELREAANPTVESRTSDGSDACGFQCPCGQCNIEKYFNNKSACPSFRTKPFPYLHVGQLSEEDKEILEHQLIDDANILIRHFQRLSNKVFTALKQNETPLDEIRKTIFSSAGEGNPKPIQTKPGEELRAITTIDDILCFLINHKYISFINYWVIEELVNQHCSKYQSDMDDYIQRFQVFFKRNIFEIPSEVLGTSYSSNKLLVVKVIDKTFFGAERGTPKCPYTLNDIQTIQTKIAKVIGHSRRFIHLVDIGKGCLQLAFLMLLYEEGANFPLTPYQLSELISHGIIILYQPIQQSLPSSSRTQTNGIEYTEVKTQSISSSKNLCQSPLNQPLDTGISPIHPLDATDRTNNIFSPTYVFSEPAGDAFSGIDFTANCFQKKKQAKFLLCGTNGVGKSSLINSLVGSNVCKVNDPGMPDGSLEPETLNISSTVINYSGISITLLDSPGLQNCTEDEEKHLSEMYDKCSDVDLYLYCMDMTQARFTTADAKCIELLTEKFGQDIWKRCVFVMTKANMVRINPAERSNQREYHKRRYETFLKTFQNKLVEIGVLRDTAHSVLGVATGSYDKNNERERYVWFVSDRPSPNHRRVDFLSELWVTCFETAFCCSRSSFLTGNYKLKDEETEEERMAREIEESRLRNEMIRQQQAIMRQRQLQLELERQQAAERRRLAQRQFVHVRPYRRSDDDCTLL